MKKYVIVLWAWLLTVGSVKTVAQTDEMQDIVVTNFQRVVTDLTASMNPVMDNNGDACAVLKFSVRDTTFVIEPNLGYLRRESKDGEIRLWVPAGTKRLTVRHSGMFPLRDYVIPEVVESKRAYHAFIVVKEKPSMVKSLGKLLLFLGVGYQMIPQFGHSSTIVGEAKFKDLISPNVQLGLGYQFSPVIAARLQANAWQSKGGWNGFYVGNEAPHTQTYKWNYVAPGIDLMFNLSNLICGYNPLRVFNVTAFLGGGANIGWGNDEVNDIAAQLPTDAQKKQYELEYLWDGSKIRPFGRGGIELGFRLSDAVSIIVEGNANILSDHYNSKKAENPDWYFNALAGLRINLGKTYNKIVPPEIY